MSAQVMYRDMTDAQRLEWGRAESLARQADLKVGGAEGLRRAQKNAEVRRKMIGATVGQAADAVIRANRAARDAA